ncbi:MAG: class I tRNA ligase family protein, partial [Nitrospiraceae bacterium]
LEIVTALTKLMAPILSFTAEEVWRTLPDIARKGITSIHLAPFPAPESRWADSALAQRWDQLLKVRETVQAALEAKRRDKVIGSSLEAQVVLHADDKTLSLLKSYEADLPALFIVSKVRLMQGKGAELTVDVLRADARKCERCWNYRDAVGTDAAHPTLCDRCVEAIR